MANGTLRLRAKVRASSVLPQPVGPTSKMFDLVNFDVRVILGRNEPLVVAWNGTESTRLADSLPNHVPFS